jgi:hypothetical protein
MSYIGISIHCFGIGVIDGYNGMPYENPYDDEEDYDAYEDGWEFGVERWNAVTRTLYFKLTRRVHNDV